MSRLPHVTAHEARGLLQLANQLHLTHDPITRKRQLIEGLCRLVDASAGTLIVTRDANGDGGDSIISRLDHEPALVKELLATSARSLQSVLNEGGLNAKMPAAGTTLNSILRLPDSTVRAGLILFRHGDASAHFPRRLRSLVHLFHEEMAWIYEADVVLTSASAGSLSPRARQTLEHLLAGESEKQIAATLDLSPNTVHHYVKVIHKHFAVSSRSELLARWVGK